MNRLIHHPHDHQNDYKHEHDNEDWKKEKDGKDFFGSSSHLRVNVDFKMLEDAGRFATHFVGYCELALAVSAAGRFSGKVGVVPDRGAALRTIECLHRGSP